MFGRPKRSNSKVFFLNPKPLVNVALNMWGEMSCFDYSWITLAHHRQTLVNVNMWICGQPGEAILAMAQNAKLFYSSGIVLRQIVQVFH